MVGRFSLEGAREVGSQSGERRQGGVSVTGRGSSSVGQPKGELTALGQPVVVASWPIGQRRKTKGWGLHVSEGEGRAGPSRPGGQGPKGVGGRAGRPKAMAQAAGSKPEPGPIQEIKPFQILFGIRIFGKV
jgi:hypothetical protein